MSQFDRLKWMKAQDFLEIEESRNSWAHAYLIIGKNGVLSEELISYIILKKNCLSVDVERVSPEEASGKRGEIKIEQIKGLLHTVNLSPSGDSRIAVIDNCERLNQSSGNILLKTLEEPPKYLTFILTAETESILPTIKSRCRIVRIPAEEMKTAGQENFTQLLSGSFAGASQEIERVVKNGEINQFLDAFLNHFRQRLLEEKKSEISKGIAEIERIRKEISQNANPRLALESLYFILKDI